MNNLPFNRLWKYGIISGILIGLICIIPGIGGWEIYEGQGYFFGRLARVLFSLFFWVIAGLFMCWLVSRFVARKQNNKGYRNEITVFLIGGIITAIAIQLAARDALVFNAAKMSAGEGGPLGEPSFETIGNFLAAGSIYVGIYVLFLRSADIKSFWRTNYLSTLTLAVMSYGLAYILWYSITNGAEPPEPGKIRAYIFEPSFPHPARIFLLPLMISILFIVYYFGLKKINKKEFDIAISYNHLDLDFTNKLYEKLVKNPVNVYKYDEKKHMADVFGKGLDEYLYTVFRKSCTYGLIIVSKNYLTSKYGTKELAALKERSVIDKNIILPVVLDGTKLSELALREDLVYLDAQQYSLDEIETIIMLKVKPKPNKNKNHHG